MEVTVTESPLAVHIHMIEGIDRCTERPQGHDAMAMMSPTLPQGDESQRDQQHSGAGFVA